MIIHHYRHLVPHAPTLILGIELEQWVAMTGLTLVTIFLGLLPYIIVRHTKSIVNGDSCAYKCVVTIFSCFGGGVLLATVMLHLLPEVRESLGQNQVIRENFDDHFPVAEMIMLSGFAVIYLVEELAHFLMMDSYTSHNHSNSGHKHKNHVRIRSQHKKSVGTVYSIPIGNGNECRRETKGIIVKNGETKVAIRMEDEVSSIGSQVEEQQSKVSTATMLRSSLALIALSFHAIVEGAAIGVQHYTDVWLMFGAVASHKFVISFCMGMELVATHTKFLTHLFSILGFAVFSPIGIWIGSEIATKETVESLPVLVVEGLAAGTILYVVFFEILGRERERKDLYLKENKAVGFIQFTSLAAGAISMGCLFAFTHDHE